MREISIRDLLDLAAAEVPDGEDRLQKVFDWHVERLKLTGQWILGAAASLVVAVLVSFFKAELKLPWWQTSLIILAAVASGSFGALQIWQLRSISRQFLAALKLYAELKKIRAFVTKYKEAIRIEGSTI